MTARLSSHMHHVPSFFGTSQVWTVQGLMLSCTNPFATSSLACLCNFSKPFWAYPIYSLVRKDSTWCKMNVMLNSSHRWKANKNFFGNNIIQFLQKRVFLVQENYYVNSIPLSKDHMLKRLLSLQIQNLPWKWRHFPLLYMVQMFSHFYRVQESPYAIFVQGVSIFASIICYLSIK